MAEHWLKMQARLLEIARAGGAVFEVYDPPCRYTNPFPRDPDVQCALPKGHRGMCFGVYGGRGYEWPGDPKKLLAQMETEMAGKEKQDVEPFDELKALEMMIGAFKQLDDAARRRVFDYLWDRFYPPPDDQKCLMPHEGG